MRQVEIVQFLMFTSNAVERVGTILLPNGVTASAFVYSALNVATPVRDGRVSIRLIGANSSHQRRGERLAVTPD
jgi:hypothetical protein